MSSPGESSQDHQQDDAAAASFAHSLAVAPLVDTSDENLRLALQQSQQSSVLTAAPTSMSSEITDAVRNHTAAIEQQQQHQLHQDFQQLQSQQLQQPERMAVAELLVSLAQNTRDE